MKKILATLAVFLSLLAPLSLGIGSAAAVNISPNCGSGSANGTPVVCKDVTTGQGDTSSNNSGTSNDPIISIIKGAINIISYVVGVASIIVLVLSGIRLMTSGGSNSNASARTSVIYAIIGIIVTAAAQAIVIFVLNKV